MWIFQFIIYLLFCFQFLSAEVTYETSFSLVFIVEIVFKDGHCIWYDQCGPNLQGKTVNCMYNGTAIPLTDAESLQTLQSVCGMFYKGQENLTTCCAPSQIRYMSQQFDLAKMMLGRCPSCFYNFRSIFCTMTCSPDQSRFLTVLQSGTSLIDPTKQTVEAILYLMADDFGQRIVDSCRDVLYPGGNQHSLDIMCNKRYDECTKEDFVRYIGVDNIQTPFPIYINFTNHTSDPSSYYNQSTFGCDEPIVSRYENQSACACLVSIFERTFELVNESIF